MKALTLKALTFFGQRPRVCHFLKALTFYETFSENAFMKALTFFTTFTHVSAYIFTTFSQLMKTLTFAMDYENAYIF
jgi:hypothetical protein